MDTTTNNNNTNNRIPEQPGSNNVITTENSIANIIDTRDPNHQINTNDLGNDSNKSDPINMSHKSNANNKATSSDENNKSTSNDPNNFNPNKRKSSTRGKRTTKKMKVEENDHDSQHEALDSPSVETDSGHSNRHGSKPYTGHRPVTSCTHCRQHKIKCNASEMFPNACSRCEKMGLHCEVDPDFRPKKGSQLQSLKNDIDELKLKLEYLTRNEGLIATALKKTQQGEKLIEEINHISFAHRVAQPIQGQLLSQSVTPTTTFNKNTNMAFNPESSTTTPNAPLSQRVVTITENMPPVLRRALENDQNISTASYEKQGNENENLSGGNGGSSMTMVTNPIPVLPIPHSNNHEFVIGDVHISIAKANELHGTFVERYLPAFPILETKSAIELYSQSQILFWTVMLTACLSDPEPTMYNKLASLIKQLAIETCWIRTPRSTHISQALLILCSWPFPNEKVLDDCSYRFVGLAKSLSLQLGLHRGRFMSEFSRTQTSMPQAEKWRTRTWLGIFFQEQLWSSILGLPSTSHNDYLIEQALLPNENIFDLPADFHRLIHLANFQAKLYRTMGSNINSPDGLIEGKERGKCLATLELDLENLNNTILKINVGTTTSNSSKKTNTEGKNSTSIEIYYLYVKLMICCFAFLPETPKKDQKKHVFNAYKSSTRIITLVSQLLENGKQQLLELPIYVRQGCTYAALMLFKLYLTPMLDNKYVDSARQSIVTVHRLYRNQLTAWATSVENDISRTASVLEKLNFVLITNPEVFIEEDGIISRMRSHLTGSLFYDLVWCIHEARRRELDPMYKKNQQLLNENKQLKKKGTKNAQRKLYPLPFYNQIAKEDFETITKTTPNGTTVTTLVPTANAIKNAKAQFTNTTKSSKNKKNKIYAINGIPLKMLDQTGSIKFLDSPLSTSLQRSTSVQETQEYSTSAPSSIVVTPNATTAQNMPLQQAHTNTFYSSAQIVGPQNNAVMKNKAQNFENNGSLAGPKVSTNNINDVNNLSVNQNTFGNPNSDVFTGSSASLNINAIPISPVPPITSSLQTSKSPQFYSQTPTGPGVSSTDLAGVYGNNSAITGQSNQIALSRNSSLLSGMNIMGRPFMSSAAAPTSDIRNTGSAPLHHSMSTNQSQVPNMPNDYMTRPATTKTENAANFPQMQATAGNQSRSQSVPAGPTPFHSSSGAQINTSTGSAGGVYQPPVSLFAYSNNQNQSGLSQHQIGTVPLRNNSQNLEAGNDGANSNSKTTVNSDTSRSLDTTPTTNNQLYNDLDTFLQQQSAGWIEDNSTTDDVLGWFDINMAPEF